MTPVDGISEEALGLLVGRFYAAVRRDPLLGPLFNGAVEDWPEHLDRLQAFWSSVMLTSGRYKGQPLAAHVKHGAQITPEMFDRWLQLWRGATEASLPPRAAEAMQVKAARIAESLSLGIRFARDRALEKSAA